MEVLECTWGLLDKGAHVALRASCKQLRQFADARLDAAELSLPCEGGRSARNKRNGKNMATVCKKFSNLKKLKVVYCGGFRPMKKERDQCVKDCVQFAAALGNDGLAAKSMRLVLIEDCQLPVAALSALLKAVPQLQALTIQLRYSPTEHLARLLKELQQCPQLTSLSIDGTKWTSTLPNDALEALCQLKQLHSLRLSSNNDEADAPIASHLLDSLPQLTTLGVPCFQHTAEVDGSSPRGRQRTASGPYPYVRKFICPPDQEQTDSDPWASAARAMHISLKDLDLFPSLKTLHGCTVYHRCQPHEQPERLCSRLQALTQRFSSCMQGWGLCLILRQDTNLAPLQALPKGCLAGLKNLELAVDFGVCSELAAAQLSAAVQSIMHAAPDVEALCLRGISVVMNGMDVLVSCEEHHRALRALLPGLRSAVHMHTMWLLIDTSEMTDAEQASFFLALANGLVTHGSSGRVNQGAGAVALKQLLALTLDSEVMGACNMCLESMGLAVRLKDGRFQAQA